MMLIWHHHVVVLAVEHATNAVRYPLVDSQIRIAVTHSCTQMANEIPLLVRKIPLRGMANGNVLFKAGHIRKHQIAKVTAQLL